MARNLYVKILRATKTQLENYGSYPLAEGELALDTTDKELYIGTGSTNKKLGGVGAEMKRWRLWLGA